MKEISIKDIEGLCIGQTEDVVGGTGVTAFVMPKGAPCGLDVRGGGPASRESELLKPLTSPKNIHAVVFAGGSAYGLDAAGGVMQCLEENNIGYNVGVCLVPLVCQADIFDLTVGDKNIRPDKAMGYAAAKAALDAPNYKDGCFGAGTGASVGKLGGMATAMKAGIGSYAVEQNGLKLGAVVCVNALGDVYDWKSGNIIAGVLTEDGKAFRSGEKLLLENGNVRRNRFVENTTLAYIATNARFDNPRLCKIAGMAHNGYARTIRPVHTSADGDTIFAASLGDFEADIDMVGTLAAEVVAEAINRAVKSAESCYGLLAAKDLPVAHGQSQL